MPHRRATAPVVALVLLLGGALSACGFDAPTDRINTIAAGVNDRSAKVDALGIRVLSSEAGQGRLIGSLANNTGDEAALTEVDGEVVTTQQFEPVAVAAGDSVNLAGEDVTAVQLTGDFVAGDVVDLALSFDTGESVTLNVPVVKYCGQYTQVPEPTVSAPSESAGESADAEATETSTSAPAADEAIAESEDAVEGDATYLCEHPTDDADH